MYCMYCISYKYKTHVKKETLWKQRKRFSVLCLTHCITPNRIYPTKINTCNHCDSENIFIFLITLFNAIKSTKTFEIFLMQISHIFQEQTIIHFQFSFLLAFLKFYFWSEKNRAWHSVIYTLFFFCYFFLVASKRSSLHFFNKCELGYGKAHITLLFMYVYVHNEESALTIEV